MFTGALSRIERELGSPLGPTKTSAERICAEWLATQYDLWNDSHGDGDRFFKIQLSLIELLVRSAQEQTRTTEGSKSKTLGGLLKQKSLATQLQERRAAAGAVASGVAEINARFVGAGLPLQMHNGLIQRSDDALIADHIEHPFWDLLAQKKWKSVDHDMKQALDRRDNRHDDAAFYALKALESALKIVSDELGRTNGKERGAAAFIDNLTSKKPDSIITEWEADMLRLLFKHVRNRLGHGAGKSERLSLTVQQSSTIIELSMSLIKSMAWRIP
jgi:hypothetical protein